MRLHGAGRKAEGARNLLAGAAFGEQHRHLPLAPGQVCDRAKVGNIRHAPDGTGERIFGRGRTALHAAPEKCPVTTSHDAFVLIAPCRAHGFKPPLSDVQVFLGRGIERRQGLARQVDDAFRFTPATRCENACASGSAAIYAARNAIRAGVAKVALVIGAEKMTALDTNGVTDAPMQAGYAREEDGQSFPMIFARFAEACNQASGDHSATLTKIAAKNNGTPWPIRLPICARR